MTKKLPPRPPHKRLPHWPFRFPTEVYLAAIGKPELLAERLRIGATLSAFERDTLACLIEGKLKPPKRKRGKRFVPHVPDDAARAEALRLPMAEAAYKAGMQRNSARADEVAAQVGDEFGITADRLFHYIRRTKATKLARAHRLQRPEGPVEHFQFWLDMVEKSPLLRKLYLDDEGVSQKDFAEALRAERERLDQPFGAILGPAMAILGKRALSK